MYPKIRQQFIEDLQVLSKQYQESEPFPHVVLDNFFTEEILDKVLSNFPNLEGKNKKSTIQFNAETGIKSTSKGEALFNGISKDFMYFLNSETFLLWLQELTGIKEKLISDPYFNGGGFHEIKKDGLLKIHADYNKHPETKLDRRINLLIYLNKDWKEEYGGHVELWSKDMQTCYKKILPLFNRIVIFNTLTNSYHGHPEPLSCPEYMSRKSIALYYFSNGRPLNEVHQEHTTIYKRRPGVKELKSGIKGVLKLFIPPIFLPSTLKKLINTK